jgi:hypothetical protein
MQQNSNFIKYASNPRAFTLKQWLAQILNNRYPEYDNLMERVATSLVTDKDMEEFGKVLMTIYETGYYKAVRDYKQECQKLGITVNVVNPQNQD